MLDGRDEGRATDAERRDDLLGYCASRRILRLYVAVDPETWDPASVADLLRAASERGIVIYAVPPGSLQNTWARSFPTRKRCNHQAVLGWIDEILRFDAGAPHPFVGVMFDIEPHQAVGRGWFGFKRRAWRSDKFDDLRDARNRRLASEYLDLLDLARERADGRLILAATIPPRFARDDAGATYRLERGSQNAVLADHIARSVDFVSVMNYADGADRESREAIAEVVARAVAFGPAESLFETAKPRRDGPSQGETLYGGGEARFRELEAMLESRFGGEPRYLGCGLHHYGDAAGSKRRGWR